jgi:hypothetical protein
MPPQTNATATAGAGGGRRDDWDVSAAAGAAKWAGEVRAYFRERVDRQSGGDGVNIAAARSLIIDSADFDAMALDTDDVVTFQPDGAGQQTGTAKASAPARLAGIPRDLQTTRIELEDV